ncbi:MAG TPA: hypothetical protein VIJ34_15285 [Acidimicrobiales bacterium]
MTFSLASGTVPVGPGTLTILDEQSRLHHPSVVLQRSDATLVPSARTSTVVVSDVLPTGNGQLRWSPAGGRPVVFWDFDVEID